MKKVFCFEVKSTSIFGDIYRIAAVVYDIDGNELDSFMANFKTDAYQKMITHSTYLDMLKSFTNFYLKHKKDSEIVVHLTLPYKTTIFKDMYSNEFIDILDIPYPLIDVSGNLQQAGYNPISVEPYNSKNGIDVPYLDADGINNPVYYSHAVALCYLDLYHKRQSLSF